MATYFEMNRDELVAEKAKLEEQYKNFQAMGLKLNMARGKPGPHQMDLAMGLLQMTDYTTDAGTDARNYGELAGLKEAKEFWADVLGCRPEECFIGGNASLTLMYDLVSKGYTHGLARSEKPWCRLDTVKWLCPAPGYDRHFKITESFGFELITIPMTPTGPDMDLVEEAVKDPAVKGMWCVPKYSNPTGVTYSDETVRRFAALKPAAKDFKIMWDNAYCVHDLTDTPDKLLNIYDLCVENGTEDQIFIFASTSKISFPGAGVAGLATSDNNIRDFKEHTLTSTIGPDKLNQLRHVLFLHDINGVRALMKGHRAILEPKFRLCELMLEENVGDLGVAEWNKPNGGYFISVDVLDGCAKRVVQLCKEAGVILTDAGATFPYGKDPHDSNIRLAPSFPPLEELEQAMEVFCCSIKLAAAEKLLNA